MQMTATRRLILRSNLQFLSIEGLTTDVVTQHRTGEQFGLRWLHIYMLKISFTTLLKEELDDYRASLSDSGGGGGSAVVFALNIAAFGGDHTALMRRTILDRRPR